MPTAKNAKTTKSAPTAKTAKAATATPKAAAPKAVRSARATAEKALKASVFSPAAVMKVAKNFDADAARTGMLVGVKQSHDAALEAVKATVSVVNRVVPARSMPFASKVQNQIQKQALANLDFAKNVYAVQNDFLGKLVTTLVVPAR